MGDPVTESLQALDAAGPAQAPDARAIEQFLLRTGRPLPRVIVVGTDVGEICRLVDQQGGDSLGVAPGPVSLARAEAEYPRGHFVNADFRHIELDASTYDGVMIGPMIGIVPKAQLVAALGTLHRALRPGGLIEVWISPGAGEETTQTSHGPVHLSRWSVEEFAIAIGALDFSLMASAPVGEFQALTLRREY
jgi:hypothetical protein